MSSAGFFARWSRRKALARQAVVPNEPSALAPPEPRSAIPPAPVSGDMPEALPGATPPPAPTMLAAEDLNGLASDYLAFLSPQVPEVVKRVALKKLFADPHFNAMDGLDVYVEDFSQGVPLSEAALAASNSFRFIRSVAAGGAVGPGDAPGSEQGAGGGTTAQGECIGGGRAAADLPSAVVAPESAAAQTSERDATGSGPPFCDPSSQS